MQSDTFISQIAEWLVQLASTEAKSCSQIFTITNFFRCTDFIEIRIKRKKKTMK